MLKSRWNIALVLAACALLLPATLSAKKQVTRPFAIRGDVTVILAPYYASATGVATHIGKYSSSAEVQGKAILIAANGDELYWDETVSDVTYPEPGKMSFTMVFTITGGTGRFAGASGSFGPVTVTVDLSTYPVLYFSYSASGTITY
jgi:hypothetical protein